MEAIDANKLLKVLDWAVLEKDGAIEYEIDNCIHGIMWYEYWVIGEKQYLRLHGQFRSKFKTKCKLSTIEWLLKLWLCLDKKIIIHDDGCALNEIIELYDEEVRLNSFWWKFKHRASVLYNKYVKQ